MRRFPHGKHILYDDSFDYHFSRSPVLNPKNHSVNWGALQLSDEAGCRKFLYGLQGDSDGNYYDANHRRFDSQIKSQKGVVADIEEQCRLQKAAALSRGSLRVPTDDPSCNRQWLAEAAKLDILQMEAEALEKRLAEFEQRKEEERAAKLKKRIKRPIGGCRTDTTGLLTEIDGQKITYRDNEPFIDDEQSPYHHMSVRKYRESVVQPHRKRSGEQRAVAATLYRSL